MSDVILDVKVLEPGSGKFLFPDLGKFRRERARSGTFECIDPPVQVDLVDLEGCTLGEDETGEIGHLIHADDLLIAFGNRCGCFRLVHDLLCALSLAERGSRVLVDDLDDISSGSGGGRRTRRGRDRLLRNGRLAGLRGSSLCFGSCPGRAGCRGRRLLCFREYAVSGFRHGD